MVKQVRITLRPPGDAAPFSVWAEQEGDAVFRLLYDYGDDLRPQPGWLLDCRAGAFAVRSVEGRLLTCDPRQAERGDE